MADFNLVYTEHARRNLLAEGIHPRRIMLTGSPMLEVLNAYRGDIEASDVLLRRTGRARLLLGQCPSRRERRLPRPAGETLAMLGRRPGAVAPARLRLDTPPDPQAARGELPQEVDGQLTLHAGCRGRDRSTSPSWCLGQSMDIPGHEEGLSALPM